MQALLFLIDTAFSLYLMVVLLRLWLQIARADFYNPLSQFIVKATNPIVIPLRRLLPSFGPLDTASLVLGYALVVLKLLVLNWLISRQPAIAELLIGGVILLISEALTLLFWVLVIRALMSWFSQGNNPVEYVFQQLTEPLLRPVRRLIPPIGGLDLSVLIVLVALQAVKLLLGL